MDMAATAVDYAQLAFDLIDEFDRMTTADQIMARLSSSLSGFGYTAFLITGVPEPPQRVEPYFLLNGWPDGWTAHYAKENYYLMIPWRRGADARSIRSNGRKPPTMPNAVLVPPRS
jgi:Autoinducer binding domain